MVPIIPAAGWRIAWRSSAGCCLARAFWYRNHDQAIFGPTLDLRRAAGCEIFEPNGLFIACGFSLWGRNDAECVPGKINLHFLQIAIGQVETQSITVLLLPKIDRCRRDTGGVRVPGVPVLPEFLPAFAKGVRHFLLPLLHLLREALAFTLCVLRGHGPDRENHHAGANRHQPAAAVESYNLLHCCSLTRSFRKSLVQRGQCGGGRQHSLNALSDQPSVHASTVPVKGMWRKPQDLQSVLC